MSEQPNPLRLLGIKEIALILGTDKANVYAWINLGTMPCVWVGDEADEPKVSVKMLEEWQRTLAERSASQSPAAKADVTAAIRKALDVADTGRGVRAALPANHRSAILPQETTS